MTQEHKDQQGRKGLKVSLALLGLTGLLVALGLLALKELAEALEQQDPLEE